MGVSLRFMDELDLYTLFGNALDNAIEQTGKFQTYMNAGYLCRYRTKKGILLVEIVNPYEEVWSMTVTICRLRPSRIQEVTDLEQKA